MKLQILEQGRGCRVVCERTDNDIAGELEAGLADLAASGTDNVTAVAGMLALFKTVAENGRMRCTRLFHEASKKDSVYSFRKGNLRVYFFFSSDGGELVVCSHAIRKKDQRAETRDVAKVVRLRDRFEAARQLRRLTYLEQRKREGK